MIRKAEDSGGRGSRAGARLSLSMLLLGALLGCGKPDPIAAAEGGRVALRNSGYADADFFMPERVEAPSEGGCSLPLEPPVDREYLDAGDFVTLVGPSGPIVLTTNGIGGYSSWGFDPSLVVVGASYDIEIVGSSEAHGIAATSLMSALDVPVPVVFTEPDFSSGALPLTSGESVQVSWEPPSPAECVLVTRGCSTPPTGPGGQTSVGMVMTEETSVILTATVPSGGTCVVGVTRQVERHVSLTRDAYVVTLGLAGAGGSFSIH